MLPRELGCSGMTCWRRLRDWQEAGVWAGLHRVLLERLADAGHLDWGRASPDSAAAAAKGGWRDRPEPAGPSPPARARRIAANRAQSATLGPTARAPRPGSGGARPTGTTAWSWLHPWTSCRACVTARDDLASGQTSFTPTRPYEHRRRRKDCRARCIQPRIARPGVKTSNWLGRLRWGVERTLAGRDRVRRLATRHKRQQCRRDTYGA
jgi:transposase